MPPTGALIGPDTNSKLVNLMTQRIQLSENQYTVQNTIVQFAYDPLHIERGLGLRYRGSGGGGRALPERQLFFSGGGGGYFV